MCAFDLTAYNSTSFEVYNIGLNETCFRFNSGKNYFNESVDILQTSRYDPVTGLLVLLDLDSFFNYLDIGPTFFKTTVFIQNHSTIFRRDQSYNIDSGSLILPGVTLLSIEREFVKKLPKPYNDCVEQDANDYVSHLFQYFIRNNKTYLRKDCLDLCIEEIMLKQCNCTEELGSLAQCLKKKESLMTKCLLDIYSVDKRYSDI